MSAVEIAAALGGHRSGSGFLCRCPVPSHGQGKGDKRPSLFIRDGDTRLLVTCFAGCDRLAVLDELRQQGLLGGENRKSRYNVGICRPRAIAAPSEPEPDTEVLAIWHCAQGPSGTLGERHLQHHRGLAAPYPPSIRFLPAAHYPYSGITLPALVTAVSRPDRKIVAVQLTFLRPSDGSKAQVDAPRWTVGKLGTGAVRLAAATDVLGLAEGVETALSAQQLSGIPCWATLGAQRLSKVTVPDAVKEIHLFADNDVAGKRDAERAAAKFAREGKRVLLRLPPSDCNDWNDALLVRGRAA